MYFQSIKNIYEIFRVCGYFKRLYYFCCDRGANLLATQDNSFEMCDQFWPVKNSSWSKFGGLELGKNDKRFSVTGLTVPTNRRGRESDMICPGGQTNNLYPVKYSSPPFHPAHPLSLSGTLDGLFEPTKHLIGALDLPRARCKDKSGVQH